jgi:predicted ATP-dependent endonuclease of OLD family
MGASTLAFFPTRRAVVVEGEADLLLFPTMLREAHGLEAVGFQIVPGLSKANKTGLPGVLGVGSGVAYFVDGDEGGRNLARELRENGVPAERIFSLSLSGTQDCELEDFIDRGLLDTALNRIIDKWEDPKKRIQRGESAKCKKYKDLLKLAEKRIGHSISKVNVAYEILDILSENPHRKAVGSKRVKAFVRSTEKLLEYFRHDKTTPVSDRNSP